MERFKIIQGMRVWLRRLGNMGRQNVIYCGVVTSVEQHYFLVMFQWDSACGGMAKFRMEDFECVPNERGETYAIYQTATECLRDAQAQEKAQAIQDALCFGMMRIDPKQRPSAELIDQIYEMLISAGVAPVWKARPYCDGAGNEIYEAKENNN